MNKFEQVSSDQHQMSLAGGRGAQVWCLGVPGLMSDGLHDLYYVIQILNGK